MIYMNRKEIYIDQNLNKLGNIFNFKMNPNMMNLAINFL
jgi:hypothetical protein